MKEAERAIFENNRRLNADGEKIANDAMIRSLDQQLLDLTAAAACQEELQKNAQDIPRENGRDPGGNQQAANQASQLLQIRALLIAQQNAEAARQAKMAEIEAQQARAAAKAQLAHLRKVVPRNGKEENMKLQKNVEPSAHFCT